VCVGNLSLIVDQNKTVVCMLRKANQQSAMGDNWISWPISMHEGGIPRESFLLKVDGKFNRGIHSSRRLCRRRRAHTKSKRCLVTLVTHTGRTIGCPVKSVEILREEQCVKGCCRDQQQPDKCKCAWAFDVLLDHLKCYKPATSSSLLQAIMPSNGCYLQPPDFQLSVFLQVFHSSRVLMQTLHTIPRIGKSSLTLQICIRTCLDPYRLHDPHYVDKADIVLGVFLRTSCAEYYGKLWPGPHRSIIHCKSHNSIFL
jgi:hypothetical protein